MPGPRVGDTDHRCGPGTAAARYVGPVGEHGGEAVVDRDHRVNHRRGHPPRRRARQPFPREYDTVVEGDEIVPRHRQAAVTGLRKDARGALRVAE